VPYFLEVSITIFSGKVDVYLVEIIISHVSQLTAVYTFHSMFFLVVINVNFMWSYFVFGSFCVLLTCHRFENDCRCGGYAS
jgi:hypothetical protein